MAESPYRIAFVCSGNICRSPMAEAVLTAMLAQRGVTGVVVDSFGTGQWHVGQSIDPRARAALQARGYDLPHHRARAMTADDLAEHDLVLAIDRGHAEDLAGIAYTVADVGKVELLRSYDPAAGADLDVPDPYYGGSDGFERVMDMVVAACTGVAEQVCRQR